MGKDNFTIPEICINSTYNQNGPKVDHHQIVMRKMTNQFDHAIIMYKYVVAVNPF